MTDLETLEAAAKLGRRLERLEAERAEQLQTWQRRLGERFDKRRAELIAEAAPEVLEKLGIAR